MRRFVFREGLVWFSEPAMVRDDMKGMHRIMVVALPDEAVELHDEA